MLLVRLLMSITQSLPSTSPLSMLFGSGPSCRAGSSASSRGDSFRELNALATEIHGHESTRDGRGALFEKAPPSEGDSSPVAREWDLEGVPC